MASSVFCNSRRTPSSDILPRFGCDQEWLATSCPSRTMRFRISGYSSAFCPTTKKVAFKLRDARRSSSFGVSVGLGPSSKVRATYGPSTYTELKVIWGPAGVEGGFGFGVEEIAFSARGTGVATCPKAAGPINKLLAMRADNRWKSMEIEMRARKLRSI